MTGGASGPFCGCYGTNNLNEGQLKCDFMTKTKPDIKKQSESNCYINNSDASCGEQGAASGDGNKNESSSPVVLLVVVLTLNKILWITVERIHLQNQQVKCVKN